MSLKTNLIRTAGGAVAVAVIMMAGAAVAQTGFKAPTGPQPGDCKRVAENVIGTDPHFAKSLWISAVNAKFGPYWSNWVAAQSTAIVFAGNGQYMATGKPCYFVAPG